MSNIGNALGRLFGGSDASFRQQLAALKSEHGTVTALARALGVDRRTVQRWQSGKIHHPKPATSEKVAREFRDVRSRGRALPGDADVRVGFTQRGKGGRERHRTVSGDKLGLQPGTMDQARRAYVAGGKEAAAAAFVDGIEDDWYHDLFEDDLSGEGGGADDTASDPTPSAVSITAA